MAADDPTDPALAPALRWSSAFRAVSGFSVGEVVAGRFRIARFIASGGMGEVYEAEDLELKERVALKTIRPDVADDEEAVDRFRREIQLARKVTHPNVCRSFDLFKHTLSPPGWEGPRPEVVFLSMELLEGETLAQRIKRGGPLRTDEALPIVEQVAAALATAHDAGIVHRDLKSSNIILAPPKSGPGIRAVLTDFGVARKGAASGADSASGSGGMAGSPAYMAPEQVRGGRVTPATDVYALGVVMFEMVTGRWPFEGDSPLATALQRLSQPAPRARSLVPDLDLGWDAAIAQCLERDPSDRPATPAAVVAALTGSGGAIGPRQRRQRRRWLGAAGAALALLAGLNALFLLKGPATGGRPRGRPTVAVLGFKNLTGQPEAAWLGSALPELLRADLSLGEKLILLPGESVARMTRELSLPAVDSLAPDTLARVRDQLGTDLVVIGTYFASGQDAQGALRLDIRVQDAESGTTVASISDTGTGADLPDLIARSSGQIRGRLGIPPLADSRTRGGGASLPQGAEATRLYIEGLEKLRGYDALGAREILEKAVAAAPDSALAHAALATAWSALGADAKAKAEAKAAFDLAAGLSREDRLLVEGRYREASGEWDRAIEVYRTLFGFFPDNLDYGLRLAAAQTAGGRAKDALETVQALRAAPMRAADEPRVDLAEALAAYALSDYGRCRVSAARAGAKATALGARWLAAEAHYLEGRANGRLSDYPNAVVAARQGEAIFARAGDRLGVARAKNLIGVTLAEQGAWSEALSAWREVQAMSAEVGNLDLLGRTHNNLGLARWQQGEFREAQQHYERSLAVSVERGIRSNVALTKANVAALSLTLGDLAAAKAASDEALALARETGEKWVEGYALEWVAERHRLQGELAPSVTRWSQALGIFRAVGYRRYVADCLSALGELALAQGDLAGARKHMQEAHAVRTALKQRDGIAASLVALAQVDLAQGHSERVEGPVRSAIEEFRLAGKPDDEARAWEVLAKSFLEARQVPAASEAIRRAQALGPERLALETRLAVATTVARVQVASGETSGAARALGAVLSEATKAGFVPAQFEARLALGQAELAAGQRTAASQRFSALADEADARGFVLVAMKARRAPAVAPSPR